ncbi:pyruvate kinase [Desulfurococcaceae archaeon MEX13E-LK6-19]|nr:pyruvate kinase [Desulfurococcaceae archaeon MEX13E-LK6-19]
MKTKILVTIGPSSADEDTIRSFMREGVAGFRINFSHGEPSVWDEYIKMIRSVEEEYGVNVALIGDLRGPQIRVGDFRQFKIRKGEQIRLVYGEKTEEEKTIPVNNRRVFEILDTGDLVLLDDGKLRFHVYDVKGEEAILLALNDGIISPRKTLIISGKDLGLPVLTQYDVECVEYAISRDMTYLALSYVRTAKDVNTLKELLEKRGRRDIGVIAKIETREALRNLSSILKEADACIVARGDLGMHYSLEEIPMLQKRIAREAIRYGKPVIVATQLLESMVSNPQPSRSEIVDIMNAVRDHVDALLLTTETAAGNYPVEAVRWLKRVVRKAEKLVEEENIYPLVRQEEAGSIRDKFAKGLVLMAESLRSKIVVYTKTGFMPSRLSRLRPRVKVLAGTNNSSLARKLSIYYGVEPFVVGRPGQDYDYEQGLKLLYEKLVGEGKLDYGDIVLQTYGRREEVLYVVKIVHVI